MPTDRSATEILHDLASHVESLVHSEVRLVHKEIDQNVRAKLHAAIPIAAGAVLGLGVFGLFLTSAVALLAYAMPLWIAALSLGVALACLAAILIWLGWDTFRRAPIWPNRLEAMGEKVEWTHHPIESNAK